MVKAALALHQRVLPPTAKVEQPNPKMGFDASPFYLNTRARPWVRSDDHPRRAAVSAFGFGGSNYHAVLEEHVATPATVMGEAPTHLFLVGASSSEALARAVRDLADAGPTVALAARETLRHWTPGRPWVAAFLADSSDALAARIDTVERRLGGAPAGPRDEVWIGAGDADRPPQLAFLFPGQGSQHVDMGATAALRYPALRRALDAADAHMKAAGRGSLAARMFPPPAFADDDRAEQERALRATEWAQPAIGAMSAGLLHTLAAFGVRADAFAGHSYGELVALYAAGVLDLDGLFAASRVRGELMSARDTDRGTMAAIRGELTALDERLQDHAYVVLANRNHPAQGVIAGPRDAVAAVVEAAADRGLEGKSLPVAAAFHSALVADAVDPFREALDDLSLATPRGPVIACRTAAPYPDDADAIRDDLAEQIVSPVDWVGVVQRLADDGTDLFVEVGPMGVLAGLTAKTLGDRAEVVSLDRRGAKEHGDVQLKRALARLAAAGVAVDPAPILAERTPDPPLQAGSKATVWLAGANHRNPETLDPPMPDLPDLPDPPAARSTPAGSVASSDPGEASWADLPRGSRPMAKPVPLERSVDEREGLATGRDLASAAPPHPPRAAERPNVSAGDLAALLASTRDTLAAFQAAQEKTAEIHGRFLDATARANDNFARLFEAQTRLLERAQGHAPSEGASVVASTASSSAHDPAVPASRPSQAAAAPPPTVAPTAPAAPQPFGFEPPDADALDTGRVHRPSTATTAVASDLPPIFDAGAAVAGKATAATAARRPAADTGPSRDELVTAMLAAVADKTGYPTDMLELPMNLEGDLGIDSIKRVEIVSAVRDQVPALPELDNDRMAALHTLEEVVDYLVEVGGGPHPGGSPMEATTTQGAPVPDFLRVPQGLGRDELQAAVFRSIAAKTGYPSDTLELPMQLEGDLGIDSIKRVEILSAVRDEVPSLPDFDNDRMASLSTVAEVVDFLASQAAGLGFAHIGSAGAAPDAGPKLLVPPSAPPVPSPPPAGLPPVQPASDVVVSVPAALRRRVVRVVSAPRGQDVAPGRHWRVLGTSDRADELREELVRQGVEVVERDPRNGVVFVADGGDDDLERAFQAAVDAPEGLFAVVIDRGGAFGRDDLAGDSRAAALTGLVKTLHLERPDSRALCLDAPATASAEAIAAELLTDRGVVEVGLQSDRVVTLVSADEQAPEPGEMPIEPGDLVVVSGGARGVTAAVVRRLAATRPALWLLGRSSLIDEPSWAADVEDADLANAYLDHERSEGRMPKPLDVRSEVGAVTKARQARRTLADVESAGATVRYVSVDVRDADAVAAVVAEAVQAHGPVRGLVHGAGVLADKRIEDKPVSDLRRVLSTKVGGLDALWAAVDPGELRVLALFSSTAGRFGNVGQCDYAMGNEALLQHALQARHDHPHLRAKVFDWGPWDGGMVDASLKAHFAEQAVGVIPLDLGAQLFVDELGRADEVEVVVEGPRPRDGQLTRTFSAHAPWLADHRIDGKPVVPVAMVLEWCTAVARSVYPALAVRAVRNLAVLKGVVFDGLDRTLTLAWSSSRPADGDAALDFELRSSDGPLGLPLVHYRAPVELGARLGAETHPGSNGLGEVPYPHPVDEAYDRFLFHGPALHGIDEIVGTSDHGMVAWLRTSTPAALGVADATWHTDPLAVDSTLQLLLLWVRDKLGLGALPTRVGTFQQLRPFDGRLACHLHVDRTDDHTGAFEAILVAEDGGVVARLEGGQYAADERLDAAFGVR